MVLLSQRDVFLFDLQSYHIGWDPPFFATMTQLLISILANDLPNSFSFHASDFPWNFCSNESDPVIVVYDFILYLISQASKGNSDALTMIRFFYNFLFASGFFVLDNSVFLSSLSRNNLDISFSVSDFNDLVGLFSAMRFDAATFSDSAVVKLFDG